MNNGSDNNSISISSSSIKKGTKDKFDALLKDALKSKNEKRKEYFKNKKYVSDTELSESQFSSVDDGDLKVNNVKNFKTNKSLKVVEVDVHQNFNTGDNNFILQKFLNDSSNNIESSNDCDLETRARSNISIKKTKKTASLSSSSTNHTYELQSPKVAQNTVEINFAPEVIKLTKDNIIATAPNAENVQFGSNKNIVYGLENSENEENLQVIVTDDSINENSNHLLENSLEKCSENDVDFSDTKPCSLIYENETRKKKKNRKNKLKSAASKISETIEAKYDYKHIIGITVHKTDCLKLDSLVIHPVVKIHIINSESGEYLQKSDVSRPVVFYYENESLMYITPVISECYNLYEKHSFYPAWEETMIINEDVNCLLEENNNVIILFEVMDFLTFSEASNQFDQKGCSRGWNKIAWAFLKPLGANGFVNIDKKVRLQLYYPDKHKKIPSHVCDIFHWWNDKKFNKYPSSLYVTVKRLIPPEKIIETFRSKTPIHGEVGSRNTFQADVDINKFTSGVNINDSNTSNLKFDGNDEKLWSKISYQSCKLPNKLMAELSGYEEGCLVSKFSNNGLFLASSVLVANIYTLVIFSVKSLEEICKLSGHQGLIYDIAWSLDDETIITVSADCTACIWSFSKQCFIEILPHPSYVYATKINSNYTIATGCFDSVVRIWCHKTHDLVQELEQHKGYITSLCFNKKSTILFSSDAIGVIIAWKLSKDKNWEMKREFNLVHLRNTIIDQILLHKAERRLLVNGRDNICIMDLKTGCVLNWFQTKITQSFKTACDFSCCGTFLFATGNDGLLNVWNSELGQLIATYTPYHSFGYSSIPIHNITFHPLDNIFAVSHYGHVLPILLTTYDSKVENLNDCSIRLKIIHEQKDSQDNVARLKSDNVSLEDVSGMLNEKKTTSEKLKFKDVIQKIDQIIINKN